MMILKRFLLPACIFLSGSLITLLLQHKPITREMVSAAKHLIAFDFTPAQTDSMLTTLELYRSSYEALRRTNIPSNIAPALQFNPLPAGFVFPDQSNSFKLEKPGMVKLPVNRDDLAFYTITQLSELIRTKKITPSELTRFFIARIKKYNGKLRNVITITEDHALQVASVADSEILAGTYKGLLHGIPFGVKDLLAQKDYPTTFGVSIYKDQFIPIDATVITRLEDAGAILIAKTSMGELAMGDVWFGGKTLNPWDTTRGSSGSSAGSASAVSIGALPFAIGSETLGSIINPAAECGVTGLRPTFGRVSKHGAMALSWSMDKIGPLTRNAEDAAIVLRVIQGIDTFDPSTMTAPYNYDGTVKSLTGYRIGFIKSDFDQTYDNHKNDSLTLLKLKELGAELVPVRYPDLPIRELGFILTAEAGANFQELVISHQDEKLVRQEKKNWPNILRSAQFIPATEYINANQIRTILIQKWYEELKGLDLYIAPCFSLNLTLTNLTGNPSVVVPNGTMTGNQRRTSITFMGQLFGEGKMLEAAKVYQNATHFHKQYPNLSRGGQKKDPSY